MPSEELGVLTPPKEEVLSRSTEDCTLDSSTSTQETELADCPQSQVEGWKPQFCLVIKFRTSEIKIATI